MPELHSLSVLSPDLSLVMGDNYHYGSAVEPFFFSSSQLDSSDLSTGYLEDALAEFGVKRRRLMVRDDDYCDHDHQVHFDGDTESYWNSNCTWDMFDNFSMLPGSRNGDEEVISAIDHHQDSSDGDGNEMIVKGKTRVAYPFAVVKPGGLEGDVTLSDINRRILKPLTRTVRHPVGEFACRPRDGRGISGKPVVGLTRIQTPGRGTITIIRTKA